MGDNVESAVFEILKKIQGDLAAFRTEVDKRFDEVDRRFNAVDARFGGIETIIRKQQRDSAGMLVMTRAVSGDFDKRVSELEQRVTRLEAQQS
jgi:BMFP domain-containing protein YqiC